MITIQLIFLDHSLPFPNLQTSWNELYLEMRERNMMKNNWQSQFLDCLVHKDPKIKNHLKT